MSGLTFRQRAAAAVADRRLGVAVRYTAGLLETKRAEAAAAYPGFEALRDWGRLRKLEVSADPASLARRFAERVEAAGGSVHFAQDGAEACGLIARLLAERGATVAVKSKSMTAEEAGLNEALAEAGVDVTETDLGEFIVQLAGEKPSHILAPAIHRDRTQVAELFAKVLGAPPGLDVPELVAWARQVLRERFLAAAVGITGANFAVAETGSLVLVTNEGNGRMATTLPRVHVAIVGIDKVIPTLEDLPGFLTLLARSASGQAISSYITAVTGPRRLGEEEGPDELHVVLLDNGRSAIARSGFREILHCLHCGSCLNHCPVYRAVGGHAYASPYPGPMGDVLSPLLWGIDAYPDLPDACTLCGRCGEICPLRIPLPDYHRQLRVEAARRKAMPAFTLAAAAVTRPRLYRAGLGLVRRLLARGALGRLAVFRAWSVAREVPRPEPGMSFRAWWAARPAPAGTPAGATGSPSRRGHDRADGAAPIGPAVDLRERPDDGALLARYLGRARAAGVEAEVLEEADLPVRLEALATELRARTVALPAQGWPEDLRGAVTSALGATGARVVEPSRTDDGYAWDRTALAGAELGVGWCAAFAADTGSLVFPSGPGLGTLASLLPPVYLALSSPDGVVPNLLDSLPERGHRLPSRLTVVTGPSRTGDIEATMATGVHGPGRVLHWVLR